MVHTENQKDQVKQVREVMEANLTNSRTGQSSNGLLVTMLDDLERNEVRHLERL
jgi:hypothetical protein